ncbi:MAG: S9 family peptidase, partial [Aquamicrobium sp.]|nr:S9 family peptidase [Aquamicrobium sp.]
MTTKAPFGSVQAPRPVKVPVEDTRHGITRTDEYAWMRADNWQEVFRDPTRLAPDIRAHLEEENAYQAQFMSDTAELREALFSEMKGRIKEDDSSVPMKDGPYAYGSSYRLGGQQPRYFRKPAEGGDEEILLDGDHEAEGKPYFQLGGIDHSSDHKRLLWAYDDKGSEFYTLRVRDLAIGAELADSIESTGGGGTWAADNNGFFYTLLDDNHRPSKVFFHQLGDDTANDRLIYEETNPGFFMSVGGTRRNDWIMISISDHETSEYRILNAADPLGTPLLVAAREAGIQYDLEEGGDIFFVLTNEGGARDFKIMTAPVSDPVRANWTELVPHQPGRLILSIMGFRDYLVRLERLDGLPRIVVHERATGEEHAIAFDEE